MTMNWSDTDPAEIPFECPIRMRAGSEVLLTMRPQWPFRCTHVRLPSWLLPFEIRAALTMGRIDGASRVHDSPRDGHVGTVLWPVSVRAISAAYEMELRARNVTPHEMELVTITWFGRKIRGD